MRTKPATERKPTRILLRRPDLVPIGPPIALTKANVSRVVMVALVVLAFLFCKNAAVELEIIPGAGANFWIKALRYRAISNEGIAAIAAATIGAQMLMRQTAFQIQPHLMFYSRFDAGRGSQIIGEERAWCVDVLNSGNGPAVLEEVFYLIKIKGISNSTGSLPYTAVRKLMVDNGIRETTDFVLQRLSRGAVISPSNPMMLLVIKNTIARKKLLMLDVVIYYRSFAGGLSVKRVSCIPEYWNE